MPRLHWGRTALQQKPLRARTPCTALNRRRRLPGPSLPLYSFTGHHPPDLLGLLESDEATLYERGRYGRGISRSSPSRINSGGVITFLMKLRQNSWRLPWNEVSLLLVFYFLRLLSGSGQYIYIILSLSKRPPPPSSPIHEHA
jgi:hypothetical protein